MADKPQAYTNSKFSSLYLEKEGKKHVEHILKAVESEPWGITLLQLSWTAGPITYVALQGGYLMGYGKTAPFALFTYFAAYTLIAGLFGLVISTTHKAYRNFRKEKAENDYLYVIDKLFYMLFQFTDLRLSQLSKQDRKYETAGILLKNTHALPESIAVAVYDLTNDKKLSILAKKMELFRRSGLFSRIKDLTKQTSEHCKKTMKKLGNSHSDAAHYLKLRLDGHAPTLKEGVPRLDGFLQRIFIAAETGDLSLMTARDAEEFLTLLYELLNGRRIELLTFRYTGKKRLQDAARRLEKIRAAYRSSKATLNYRIESLFSILVNNNLISGAREVDIYEKYEQIHNCIHQCAIHFLSVKEKSEIDDEYTEMLAIFKKAMTSHELINKNYKLVSFNQKQLKNAIHSWQTISNEYNSKKTEFRYGKGKRGLRIAKKTIYLDDETKLQFSKRISGLIADFLQNTTNPYAVSANTVKQFIISIALEAEEFLHLSHPVIQYGIESSNAINLGSLEQGISAEVKALWAAAMVKEVKKNVGRSAEKLAKVLVNEYDEELDEEAIEFLHHEYGASKNNLKKFVDEKISSDQITIKEALVEVKPDLPQWNKAQIYANKLIRIKT